MRIAVFADEKEASCRYRALEPMEALSRRGHLVVLNGSEEVAALDVVHISRYIGDQIQGVVRYLRRAGLGVVWDHDDAWHLAPHLRRGGLEKQKITAQIGRMLRFADVVTTTSDSLADSYRSMGAESVHVIENYLGPHFAGLERGSHDGVVVGWAAWLDHQADWTQLELKPVFERLLDAHPDLRVESVGQIDLGLRSERYTRVPQVPFPRLGAQLTRFDVGIAPIADTPFNRARSSIKVKEYAAAGAAWLASPIGPYVGLGEKQGGRLVPDDRWYEEIDQLIRNQRQRRKLAKRASRWGDEQMLERNLDRWTAALGEAHERAGSRRTTRV
jgi:hypothetical protein